ncbi:MAG: hypothetical protein K2X66_08490 [Cyanobacteria bacterium]|nr:hypothetical protein [Cyanobacteriota bacterium]
MQTSISRHSSPLPFRGDIPGPTKNQQEQFQHFLSQNADEALKSVQAAFHHNYYNNASNEYKLKVALLILDKFFPSAKAPRQGSNLSLLA